MKECRELQKNIIIEIVNERILQDKRWGKQNHSPFVWLAILGEEFGEANKAILQCNDYRNEMIQVAAVAIAAIESLDSLHEERNDTR